MFIVYFIFLFLHFVMMFQFPFLSSYSDGTCAVPQLGNFIVQDRCFPTGDGMSMKVHCNNGGKSFSISFYFVISWFNNISFHSIGKSMKIQQYHSEHCSGQSEAQVIPLQPTTCHLEFDEPHNYEQLWCR
jgi:hypothetical protein